MHSIFSIEILRIPLPGIGFAGFVAGFADLADLVVFKTSPAQLVWKGMRLHVSPSSCIAGAKKMKTYATLRTSLGNSCFTYLENFAFSGISG